MTRHNADAAKRPLAYIISPQPWAGFYVSKHHYACALAERGWWVVFVDPPSDLGQAGRIEITATDVPSVVNLRYQTFFPYPIKFWARALFDRLMRRQARQLVRAAGRPDLVWDFDNAYQFRDLRVFGARTTLFHLVDDVGKKMLGTKRADHVFYLHRSFCENAGGTYLADHEIGHGLGRIHCHAASLAQDVPRHSGLPHVGFVGNLAASWVDWTAIARMVHNHPNARFTFWGPLGKTARSGEGLRAILESPSARFPGLTPLDRILKESDDVDVWLLPFKADRLQSGAINSHKVLEYLSTGRAVVMNWLEAYVGNPLVYMLDSSNSDGLADLLDSVLLNLDIANAPENMARRRAFAIENSYQKKLDQVDAVVGLTQMAACSASFDTT